MSELNISLYAVSVCTDPSYDAGGTLRDLSVTNYTLTQDLKCLIDHGDYYLWSVRANDSAGFSSWTSMRNLSIQALIDLAIPNNTILFGNLYYLASNDTVDNSPNPIILRNDGNAFMNITVSATSLWSTSLNPTNNYQFKADNVSSTGENNSFTISQSQLSYRTFNNSSDPALICLANFNYTDATDSAEFDVNITVPLGEPAGYKTSTLTFIGSLSE